jgi:hypothetical protein
MDIKDKLQKLLMEEVSVPPEAFDEIESELRTNARQMGIDYDHAIIVNTNRTLRSAKDMGDWSSKRKQWAGYGSSWLDWVRSAMPHWLATKFYVLTVNNMDIVSVNDPKSMVAFTKKYVARPGAPKDAAIDFQKLYDEGKGGVAFRPYNKAWAKMGNDAFFWYRSIDVDSIVIVNNKTIRSVKLLLDASEIIADYKERNSDY